MSVGTITWIYFCLNWQMLMRHLSLFVRITVRLIPKCTRWDSVHVNSDSLMCSSHIFVVSGCRCYFNWAPWVEYIAFTSTSLSLYLSLSTVRLYSAELNSSSPFILTLHKTHPALSASRKTFFDIKSLGPSFISRYSRLSQRLRVSGRVFALGWKEKMSKMAFPFLSYIDGYVCFYFNC